MEIEDVSRRMKSLDQQAEGMEAEVEALWRQRQQHAPGSADYILLSGELNRHLVDLQDVRADLDQAGRRRWQLCQEPKGLESSVPCRCLTLATQAHGRLLYCGGCPISWSEADLLLSLSSHMPQAIRSHVVWSRSCPVSRRLPPGPIC